ncbi:uncharacterized protein LOC119107263 [Pollicipes pollicipes]|uniref:uncharacterized protein LOC119107263 n=1 Tax=Pollicipes pollicipes TaxID=41117 RepID=UPI001884E37C|nr:uncharacterized protein LOC119107263 [Pollicipes pollicipes]
MRLQGCCGCFNLRNGTVAIGATLLTLYCMSFVFFVTSVAYPATMIHEWHETDDERALMIVSVVNLSVFASHLLFNSLLVYGAFKGRRGMVLAWLVYHGIFTSLHGVAVAAGLVYICVMGLWLYLIVVSGCAALLATFWYWFAVVLSFFWTMPRRDWYS